MSTIIDAKGKPCPTPVILAKQAMAAGEHSFTVLVDNTTAVENLKRLAGNQGFGRRRHAQGEGVYSRGLHPHRLRRLCRRRVSAPLPAPGGDWAVFVGRDIIGDGDRELGANLMRMFFYTLAQGEDQPGAVLFMNAGVQPAHPGRADSRPPEGPGRCGRRDPGVRHLPQLLRPHRPAARWAR